MNAFITPEWSASHAVKALITTRYSPLEQKNNTRAAFGDFNVALHVGDDADTVNAHRQTLVKTAALPDMPVWLNQVHGTQVHCTGDEDINADAAYRNEAGRVAAVMTADCLPVLLASKDGREVAAVHAGWRGLLAGVIEQTLQHFSSQTIIAYLGPAISQQHYQVGEEVYAAFISHNAKAKNAFIPDSDAKEKYKMNIYALAKQRLHAQGVQDIYGGNYCTYAEDRFYSYRQACHQSDGQTGRMASLIWIQK